MKKGIWKIVVFFVFVYGIAWNSQDVMATTINDLQTKFPNGAYWNHVVQNGHGYSGTYHIGPCNNPDGYTWSPCDTHNGNAGIGGHDCNSYGGAIQCCGFVKKLANDLYGSTHNSWGTTTLSNAKSGDVIHYYGGGADATYGHWAMIIGKSGSVLTLGECNAGGNCKISWGRCLNISSANSYIIYSAPWAATTVSDTSAPVISDVKITDVSASGYTVTCTVSDNVGVTKVEFPSWNADKHSGSEAVWLQGTISGNKASVRVNIANLASGAVEGNYMTHIYAYDAAGNKTPCGTNGAWIDRTAPTISGVQVSNVTEDGYIIQCKVLDNADNGVDRVQFPTWTESNGQDDIAAGWISNTAVRGTKSGNIYTFMVKTAEHNNEVGLYHTHIYAYDKHGNYTVKTQDIAVKKTAVEPEQTKKLEYRYRDKQVTTSNSSTLEGWTNVESMCTWSDYGAWSAWSRNTYTASDSRKVESRVVTDQPAYTINNYYYYRYWNSTYGAYYYTYSSAMGGTKYTFSQKVGDSPAMYVCGDYSGHTGYQLKNNNYGYGVNFDSEVWFLESSTTVPASTHTEYRYADRVKKYTYIFEKWGEWSEWSSQSVTATNYREVEVREQSTQTANEQGQAEQDLDKSQTAASQTETSESITTATVTSETGTTQQNDSKQPTATVKYIKKSITLKSAKSKSKGKITVTWKKVSNASGYQVRYSLKKNMKSSKTVKVSNKKTSVTLKKLKTGKKYYIQVRAYQKVKGKTYYGNWSSKKNAKVKK